MKWNKVVFKFVSISFSILVALLVVVGLIELGSYCYDFGYRVFTESPVDETPGRDVTVSVTADMSEHDIGKMLKEEGLVEDATNRYLSRTWRMCRETNAMLFSSLWAMARMQKGASA